MKTTFRAANTSQLNEQEKQQILSDCHSAEECCRDKTLQERERWVKGLSEEHKAYLVFCFKARIGIQATGPASRIPDYAFLPAAG